MPFKRNSPNGTDLGQLQLRLFWKELTVQCPQNLGAPETGCLPMLKADCRHHMSRVIRFRSSPSCTEVKLIPAAIRKHILADHDYFSGQGHAILGLFTVLCRVELLFSCLPFHSFIPPSGASARISRRLGLSGYRPA